GGAFDGIERIVEKRLGNKVLGFGAEIRTKAELDQDFIMSKVIPQDLVRFGIIPELVGRMPVLTSLENLNKEALVRIIREPKNALLKQYQSLFRIDGVDLFFEEDALEAIAESALEKKTGARGLRSIMENVLLPIMYETPSDKSIISVTVTKECVTDGEKPIVEYDAARLSAPLSGHLPVSPA
ncbi:MAG: ATP-dependent Clp protease ATP-binding subunit ClpX, partial [Clostridia bacterium]|nr:ATP-dependent Clp protease ATP-binding subunit ClpX [Clostridia bacterium]